MKVTQKIEAGQVKSFWITYSDEWQFTLGDGSEVTMEVNDELVRQITKKLSEKVAEKDAELLEEAKAKVEAELESVDVEEN